VNPPRTDGAVRVAGDARLDRAIGPWTLGANAVNLTVGAGIFALPALVAAMLGPAAVLAYLVCGVLIVLVMACFAEVGSRVTRSGGAIAYIEEAFGPLAGFLAWATFALGFSVASDAAIANVLVDALATVAPALGGGMTRALALGALFGGLAAINIRGVRYGTRLAVGVTIAKLLPLGLLIVVGVFSLNWRELVWGVPPSLGDLGAASLVLFFAFAGMESALTPSGEIRDPARTVPRGMLGGAAALILLYMALQLTAQGTLGAQLPRETDAPLAAVAEHLLGPAGRALIVAGTALAIFGALSADTIGTPRAFFAAAESGMLPASLAIVHSRWRTPWVAVIVFAVLTWLLAITGGFRSLAVLSSLALLLVYLGVCLAALRLRYARPPAPGSYRAPGGPIVPVLASATVLWLLAHSTRAEAGAMTLLLAATTLYYYLARGRRPVVEATE
jgi:basic amino acid/polyamine antiporter, APA family